MSEMPEQIWAGRVDGYGQWWEGPDIVGRTPYTRADIAAAQVAAAYERAADLCVDQFQAHLDLVITGNPDNARNRDSAANMAEKLSHEIRALATDTQADALELVRKEAERACIGMLAVMNCDDPQDMADQVVSALKAPNRHAYKVGFAAGKAWTPEREQALQELADLGQEWDAQEDDADNGDRDD